MIPAPSLAPAGPIAIALDFPDMYVCCTNNCVLQGLPLRCSLTAALFARGSCRNESASSSGDRAGDSQSGEATFKWFADCSRAWHRAHPEGILGSAELLQIAYFGKDQIEHFLDPSRLGRRDEQTFSVSSNGDDASMKLTCDEIASATGLLPAKTSGKEILFHCPNHEDKHPSLSINVDKNTWICGPCGRAGTAWKFAAFLAHCDPSDKATVSTYLRRIRVFSGSASGKPPDKIYSYSDENGTLLYQVLRFDGVEGKKRFSQRTPDGNGGWCWNLNGVRRVLYRLPEFISDASEKRPEMVYVAEGEKDIDALREHGLTATTNPGGAGKWRAEYSEQLRASGSECIVIFPDNDQAGENHALGVAGFCRAVGLRVKIVKLPGLPQRGMSQMCSTPDT